MKIVPPAEIRNLGLANDGAGRTEDRENEKRDHGEPKPGDSARSIPPSFPCVSETPKTGPDEIAIERLEPGSHHEHGDGADVKIAGNIAGYLLVLIGAVWALQGLNLLGGSFMTGQYKWLIIGING